MPVRGVWVRVPPRVPPNARMYMKVHIGPYIEWIGPYQLAQMLKYVGVSDDRCHDIGHWLASTWVGPMCQWIHNKRERVVKVHIDSYDVWSADHTLAYIISPMLKVLRTQEYGMGFVDDEDVPESIRKTNDPNYNPNEPWELDSFFGDRWLFILDEMIWAFDQVLLDDEYSRSEEETKAHSERMQNGFRLFGKYYQSLWS